MRFAFVRHVARVAPALTLGVWLLNAAALSVWGQTPPTAPGASPPPAAAPAGMPPSGDYFPLVVGAEWTYDRGGETLVIRLTGEEEYGGVNCFVRETLLGGEVLAREHVAAGPDGVYRHSLNGQPLTPPLRFVNLPLKAGDEWDAATQVGDSTALTAHTVVSFEVVRTLAGQFDALACRAETRVGDGARLVVTTWCAPGVGQVQQSVLIGTREITSRLTACRIPGGPTLPAPAPPPGEPAQPATSDAVDTGPAAPPAAEHRTVVLTAFTRAAGAGFRNESRPAISLSSS